MAYRRQKISQMPPKGANLEATDLMEISEVSGTGYITKSITGQEIIDAASGGAIDLQQVTDNGSTTTNAIEVTAGVNEHSTISGFSVTTENIPADTHATLNNTGSLALKTGAEESSLQNTNVTIPGVILEFPDASGTIALTSDIPTFITPRVQTVASAATVTPTSTNDIVTITAQLVGLTLANPTGTFVEGQSLIIRIKDDGTAQSIAYGTNFRAIGVTAPTTTVANKTTYIGCIYNDTDTKFDIIGVCTEA